MRTRAIRALTVPALSLLLSACGSDSRSPVEPSLGPLVVSSIDPPTGTSQGGTPVVITGAGFGTEPAAIQVTLGAASAVLLELTDSRITALTQPLVLTDPAEARTVDLVITRLSDHSRAVLPRGFTYLPDAPISITGVQPGTLATGSSTPITVLGSSFALPLQVFVRAPNGCSLEATVSSLSASRITALVDIPSSSCFGAGPVDLEIINPVTHAQGICQGCLAITTGGGV